MIAISAVYERSTGFALGRTGRANSCFVIKVAFLGYTPLGSYIYLSIVFESVAGNTSAVIVAGVAVIRTFAAS